ncbi:superoxide dismutase [Flavobacterium subsaxonicum]|uniref:Superoxide dismutase n=1 Tax=Flavobacterium subsaxonicum WB 4.1-42 = DSM 21790 TaxID=1121898 RepID=A0A0A2MF71_9FLAO|nr:superoxide dismutase [Flavobacterium subsaxonicum]KGO90939.1 superoxide dismutase [Flavobacterium subsaxonicum WB 4.1-42 = DSM 21790]
MKKVKIFFSALAVIAALQSCKDKDNLEEVVATPEPQKEAAAPALGNPDDVKAEAGPFQMLKLPYAYDALAPNIDAKTMELHYSKHYKKYTDELNKAIKGTPLEKKTIEEILATLDLENKAVRNNGGGYYNHGLFWEVMAPNAGGEPKGALAEAIKKDFGSFEAFKTQFTEAATKQFGSGWAWLVVDKTGKLVVGSTANQDNPLMPNQSVSGKPVLALDVWEHAYYLNYQNKRPDYITAFYNVVNWDTVSKKYEAAIAK